MTRYVFELMVGAVAALGGPGPGGQPPAAEQTGRSSAPEQAIRRWQQQRFGMFIHWGPVSLKGTEIGWSRGREIPIEEYDQLYKHFNPVKFDADQWVRLAKDAGMKYIVITSKHHDGFCLWPSKYTDYHIGNSPFGRDVLGELSAACRRHGIAFSTYYSVCDWHHPDFPRGSPGGRTRKPHPNLDRYIQYLRHQVTELIRNYGPLQVMWFDVPQEVGPELGKPTVALVRSLQPDIIVNNRAYRDPGHPVGDYDTPEQRVGAFNRRRPWETCMTIGRQWAWRPNDQIKSLRQCVQTLLRVVGGDGNFLFNVGPMPDGRIEARQAQRLRQMGRWLSRYGDGVYGTRGGPFKPGRWGAATCKDNKVFLFIMEWPESGPLRLPPLRQQILATRTRSGGSAAVEQTQTGITVAIDQAHRDSIATVVELTVSGKAFDIEPVGVGSLSGSLAFGRPARASNVYRKMVHQFGPAKALDDDPESRWATDAGTASAWLEVDLGQPRQIGRARIMEAYPGRVRQFQLQYHDGHDWKSFHTGQTIGKDARLRFEPITARRLRLNILKATEGPTIWEFQLFPPASGP